MMDANRILQDLSKQDEAVKTESTKAEPLAPPPRPSDPAVADTPDYFSKPSATNLSHEPNPFDYSFAGGQNGSNSEVQTPNGSRVLPSVAALTSPSGILGPASSFSGIWGNSLRSGPLSPAMLSGPQKDDYFSDGHHLRGGFPTPNESSMRSGLTPGGGGSMFPDVQTPNTTALYNQLQSGGATPGTLDFHRTALVAAAHARRDMPNQQAITSQPQDSMNGMDAKPVMPGQFNENDAANGLFLLANTHTRNNQQAPSHYAMAQNMPVHSHPQQVMNMGGMSQEASPTMANRTNGSISTTSGRGMSEMSDEEQPNRPNTRGKGKRNSTQISNTNGRPKETPSKPAKKAKTNAYHMEPEPVQSEDEQDMSKDEYNANGKKMTDEEKRKNFLERNRYVLMMESQ
jgi:ATF/CREB family transcription factor